MPQIHTMCLPIGADGGFTGSGSSSGSSSGGGKTQGPGPGSSHEKVAVTGSQETGLVQGTGLVQPPIAAVVTSIVPGFVKGQQKGSTGAGGVNGDGGGNGKTKPLQLGNSPYNATTTNNNTATNNNSTTDTPPVITSDNTLNQKGGEGGPETYESEFLRSGYADLAESRMEVRNL